MQIMVALPVLFRGKALRGDGMKTMLTFVPTAFDIPELEADDAPLVAVLEKTGSTSEYRSYDGTLYGSLILRNRGSRDDGSEIVRRIHAAVGERISAKLEGARIDDLYPKDAKELIGLISKHPGYKEYLERIEDRIAARNMDSVTAGNPEYEAALAESRAIAAREAGLFFLVDGQRFQKTVGLNICVESHYNQRVIVTESEPWNGTNWLQRPEEWNLRTDLTRTRYFGLADREAALSYAEEVGAKLGQRVLDKTGEVRLLDHVDNLPAADWTWAEVVRSATLVARVVGDEIARRIRNREESIFTDDPTLRYTCDRLLEALRGADAFGEPDDRVEFEANSLLSYIKANAREIDARYRDLASKHEEFFDHLRTSLERSENRDVEFVVGRAAVPGRPGL